MLTDKDYCDLKTTKELESLGMNVYTSFGGVDVLKHVLLYEAQKWLREAKKMEVNAFWDRIAEKWYSYIDFMYYPDLMGIEVTQSVYDSYEEALSKGINEAIKILKDGIGEQEVQNE